MTPIAVLLVPSLISASRYFGRIQRYQVEVSVLQYDDDELKLNHTLSTGFGNAFDLNEVKSCSLADFCVRCGINRLFIARELVTICSIALDLATAQTQDPMHSDSEREFVQMISVQVMQRARQLKAIANEIPRYKSNLL